MPLTDCTTYCSFLTGGTSTMLSYNTVFAKISLRTYFEMQIDVVNPSIHLFPTISNIFDLRDTSTGK